MKISDLQDEALRNREFPVTEQRVFAAHAGVTALPRVVADAVKACAESGSRDHQENPDVWAAVGETRGVAAELLFCSKKEVALLGPTSLGLNLVANGFPWREGDEVVYYPDDYPANVYPWTKLTSRGVKPVPVRPEVPGQLTWPVVEAALTPRTRMVALASCHYLSGFRMDLDGIGRQLQERDIRFCVDGIQTLGAFPLRVEHVDYLAADAHKWMLGPVAAGIFYVKEERQEELAPTLLGAWNVHSPDFIAQEEIVFERGGRRYEPGSMNSPGILGMRAGLELLLGVGIEEVSSRILRLRNFLQEAAGDEGYLVAGCGEGEEDLPEAHQSGILSLTHPKKDMAKVAGLLAEKQVSVSLRRNRAGEELLRISPHFYNTEEEMERIARLLA